MKTISRCKECDSPDVYADAWVGCNDETAILGPYDTYFCVRCDGECSIYDTEVTPEEYDRIWEEYETEQEEEAQS
jgi:hypothetical protein